MSGTLAVAASALLWGLWPLWIRGGPGGPQVAAIAFVAAGLAGLPLAISQGRGRIRSRFDWLGLVLLAAIDCGNVWLYFRALDEGAVAPAVLAHYLAPVLVAVTAPTLLREPRSPRTPVALALALAGTAAMVLGRAGPADASTMKALLLGGASAVFYAAMVILSKRLAPRFGDAELLIYHILIAAGLIVLIERGAIAAPAQLLRPALGGLISTLLAGLLYYHGLRRIPAERAAILAYLEPPAAMLVGWVAFGETPTWAAAAGGALILGGGALVTSAPTRAPE